MPRRQLLLVVVVFGVAAGPLDPGSGLTGTLHYREAVLEVAGGRRAGSIKGARGGRRDAKKEGASSEWDRPRSGGFLRSRVDF